MATPEDLVAEWKREAREFDASEDFDGFTAGDVASAYRRCARQLADVLIAAVRS